MSTTDPAGVPFTFSFSYNPNLTPDGYVTRKVSDLCMLFQRAVTERSPEKLDKVLGWYQMALGVLSRTIASSNSTPSPSLTDAIITLTIDRSRCQAECDQLALSISSSSSSPAFSSSFVHVSQGSRDSEKSGSSPKQKALGALPHVDSVALSLFWASVSPRTPLQELTDGMSGLNELARDASGDFALLSQVAAAYNQALHRLHALVADDNSPVSDRFEDCIISLSLARSRCVAELSDICQAQSSPLPLPPSSEPSSHSSCSPPQAGLTPFVFDDNTTAEQVGDRASVVSELQRRATGDLEQLGCLADWYTSALGVLFDHFSDERKTLPEGLSEQIVSLKVSRNQCLAEINELTCAPANGFSQTPLPNPVSHVFSSSSLTTPTPTPTSPSSTPSSSSPSAWQPVVSFWFNRHTSLGALAEQISSMGEYHEQAFVRNDVQAMRAAKELYDQAIGSIQASFAHEGYSPPDGITDQIITLSLNRNRCTIQLEQLQREAAAAARRPAERGRPRLEFSSSTTPEALAEWISDTSTLHDKARAGRDLEGLRAVERQYQQLLEEVSDAISCEASIASPGIVEQITTLNLNRSACRVDVQSLEQGGDGSSGEWRSQEEASDRGGVVQLKLLDPEHLKVMHSNMSLRDLPKMTSNKCPRSAAFAVNSSPAAGAAPSRPRVRTFDLSKDTANEGAVGSLREFNDGGVEDVDAAPVPPEAPPLYSGFLLVLQIPTTTVGGAGPSKESSAADPRGNLFEPGRILISQKWSAKLRVYAELRPDWHLTLFWAETDRTVLATVSLTSASVFIDATHVDHFWVVENSGSRFEFGSETASEWVRVLSALTQRPSSSSPLASGSRPSLDSASGPETDTASAFGSDDSSDSSGSRWRVRPQSGRPPERAQFLSYNRQTAVVGSSSPSSHHPTSSSISSSISAASSEEITSVDATPQPVPLIPEFPRVVAAQAPSHTQHSGSPISPILAAQKSAINLLRMSNVGSMIRMRSAAATPAKVERFEVASVSDLLRALWTEDEEFVRTVLLTHQTFITSGSLWATLRHQFRKVRPFGQPPQDSEFDYVTLVVHNRIKILGLIHLWIEMDLIPSYLEPEVAAFLLQLGPFTLQFIPAVTRELVVWANNIKNNPPAPPSPPPPPSPSPRSTFDPLSLFVPSVTSITTSQTFADDYLSNLTPALLAQIFTVAEWNAWTSVRPIEFLEFIEDKANAPNLIRFIHLFTLRSRWLAKLILTRETMQEQMNLIMQLTVACDICRYINSFSALFSISSAIFCPQVYSLYHCLRQLPKQTKLSLRALQQFLSPEGAHSRYQHTLATVQKPPCIPYIGTILRTLISIDECHPDSLANGSINFAKRKHFYTAMIPVIKYRNIKFSFHDEVVKNHSQFVAFISDPPHITEEELDCLASTQKHLV